MNEKETALRLGSIHGIEITAVKNEMGQLYVPVKPICSILGVDFSAQRVKIYEDKSFKSTVAIIATVGADGKNREMVCLPVKHICGWLYSINPGKVSPEAEEKILGYREEVNDLLTAHFFGCLLNDNKLIEEEREAMKEKAEADEMAKEARARQKAADEKLRKIRDARLGTES